MSDDGTLTEQDAPADTSNCTVLTQTALRKDMDELVSEVGQFLEISHGAIRILLNKYKWDKDHLLEKFYECEEMDEFLRGAKVAADPSKMGDGVDGEERECDICCSMEVLSGPSCRHFACKGCWQQYLTTKVASNTPIIECMYPGCKLLMEDEQVLSLIGNNQATRAAFTRLSINCFVESNKRLRWCPAAGCDKALKVRGDVRPVECECKCRSCFECGFEWHDPIDCQQLKAWEQKCKDDSETSNWLNANTKDCPKCHTAIEKNGGCNHMTCKKSSCGYEFCWLCLGDWKKHTSGGYSCNAYDDSKGKQDSRAALERYLHYYNRFMNHQQSRGLENKLKDTVKVQMEKMQHMGMTWVDVQYLEKAVDVLAECRQTLMYTYAFAYYLKKTNDSEIFEANQRDLELATEQLSGFLERDLDEEKNLVEMDLSSLKQKVQDKYRYVDQRRRILLNHCADGVEEGVVSKKQKKDENEKEKDVHQPYAAQMAELRLFGFEDADQNMNALLESGGSVDGAMEFLFAMRESMEQ